MKACGDLLPQHKGNAVQEEEAPYFVEVKSTQVTSLKTSDIVDGKNITAPSIKGKHNFFFFSFVLCCFIKLIFIHLIVSITSDDDHKFKGFLLVARDANGKSVGSFDIPLGEKSSKTLDCDGAAKVSILISFRLLLLAE